MEISGNFRTQPSCLLFGPYPSTFPLIRHNISTFTLLEDLKPQASRRGSTFTTLGYFGLQEAIEIPLSHSINTNMANGGHAKTLVELEFVKVGLLLDVKGFVHPMCILRVRLVHLPGK